MSYLYVEHDVLVSNRRYVKTRAEGKAAREPDLFRLVVVNSYGSQEVQRLKDDDSIPLKLGSEWMCVLREEEGVWREGECGGVEGDWMTGLCMYCFLRSDVHCV